jgi:short chain dehydrogenase
VVPQLVRAPLRDDAVLEQFGRLDDVVTNAGISVFKPSTDIEEADDNRVMDTNTRGITVNPIGPGGPGHRLTDHAS